MRKIIYRFLFSFLFLLIISLSSFSQVMQQWVTPLYPANDTTTFSRGMTLDNGGYVYVFGGIVDSINGYSDFLTGKYDPINGNILWSKTYGSSNAWEDDNAYSISVDNNSNIYVSGITSVSVSNAPKTIKYNTNGIQQWVAGNGYQGGKNTLEGNRLFTLEGDSIKQYDLNGIRKWSTSINNPTTIASDAMIVADKNKNTYVAGRHTIVNPTEQSIILKKYDSTGIFKWERQYHPTFLLDVPSAITIDDSANIYLFGTQDWQNTSAYTLAKYDSAGNQKWAKSYSGLLNAKGQDIVIDKIHNVYVSGTTANSSITNYDIVKYDVNGNFKWFTPYDSASVNGSSSLALDSSGNIYMTCAKKVVGTSSDIATIKLDIAGNIKWEIRYNQTISGAEYPSELIVEKDGDIYVTGTSAGELITIKYSQTTGIDELGNGNNFIIYPNPTNGIFTIQSSEKFSQIEIINLLGEKIYSEQINSNKREVDLTKQPKGIYFIKINSEKGTVTKKVIIQ